MICRNDHGRAYICSSLLYYYNADQSFAGEEKASASDFGVWGKSYVDDSGRFVRENPEENDTAVKKRGKIKKREVSRNANSCTE